MRETGWYTYHDRGPQPEGHPIDLAVEQRLRRCERYQDLRERIRHLSGELRDALSPDQRNLWLQLDEAINARAMISDAVYFNVGVDQGIALQTLDGASSATSPMTIVATVVALARTLLEQAQRLADHDC